MIKDDILDRLSTLSAAARLDKRGATMITEEFVSAIVSEIKSLRRAVQTYTYIGKDGKPRLARDMEDEIDRLTVENAELWAKTVNLQSACKRLQRNELEEMEGK